MYVYICIKSIRQIRRAHFTRCRTVSFAFLPVPFSSFSAFSFCCECDFNFSIQFTFATATQTHLPLPQYPVLTPTQIRMRMRMGEQTQSASKSCKKRRQKEIASYIYMHKKRVQHNVADWGIPCARVYYDIHCDSDPSISIGLNSLDINFIGFGNVDILGWLAPSLRLQGMQMSNAKGRNCT